MLSSLRPSDVIPNEKNDFYQTVDFRPNLMSDLMELIGKSLFATSTVQIVKIIFFLNLFLQ